MDELTMGRYQYQAWQDNPRCLYILKPTVVTTSGITSLAH